MSKHSKFFKKKFDESTKVKLLIFQKYVEDWLPVFLKSGYKDLYIFDFFAGPGYDLQHTPGSPILTLMEIEKHLKNIADANITLFLNENKKQYFKQLKENCNSYLKKYPALKTIVHLKYSDLDFQEVFGKLENKIGKKPSLVFLDQFGVKYGTYVKKFEQFEHTDFLLFISSSSLKRFANTKEFKNALSLSDEEIRELKNAPYKLIHEFVVSFLRKRLNKNTMLKLYPFSIKKGRNIYGLIFGTKHVLAADKFLRIAWKINPKNGSANYDIYDDKGKQRLHLFSELDRKTTIQSFQEDFKKKVLEGTIKTNEDGYYYAIEKGHIPKHADEVLRKLKKDGIITYKGKSPLINYNNVVKQRRIIEYEKNED